MKLCIRTAEMGDLERLAEIERICFPPEEAADIDSIRKRLESFPDRFWVAEQEGQIIGFLNGFLTDSSTITDEMYERAELHCPTGAYQAIFGLDTHPDFQRQGVASALMKQVIAQCRQEGRKGLFLTCKPRLVSFYEQFGYQNRGVSASVHGGAVWHDMLLLF